MDDGGQLSAQGRVVPGTGAMQADVRVGQLALAPFQPLLRQVVKLRLTQGSVSGQGRITTGEGSARPRLRYAGSSTWRD